MKSDTKPIELQAEIEALKIEISGLKELVSFYEEQYRLSQQRQFGASSEKGAEQLGLFDEVENTGQPELEQIIYTRRICWTADWK